MRRGNPELIDFYECEIAEFIPSVTGLPQALPSQRLRRIASPLARNDSEGPSRKDGKKTFSTAC